MTEAILAQASQRINAAFSQLTTRGGPWRFAHAKPFAEAVDAAAQRWAGIYGSGTEGAFERALVLYVNALQSPRPDVDPRDT